MVNSQAIVLYLQVVKGASPTVSGLRLLPLMGGLLLTSTLSGQLISRWGRYKIFPVAGTGIFSVGLFLLSRMNEFTTALASSIAMFTLGLGLGMVMQVLVIVVQNAVAYRDLGVATSGATFFRSIGGSCGVAIFGAIFSSALANNLQALPPGILPPGISSGSASENPAGVDQLPPAIHAAFVHVYALSLQPVFLVAAGADLTISPAACWLLCKINRIGPSTAEQLSVRLRLPAVILTQPLQELTHAGLLVATPHTEDGRTGAPELYSLTPTGQEAHRRVLAAERAELDRLLKGWSPDQESELAALLTQMSERFLIDDAGDGELVTARSTGVA